MTQILQHYFLLLTEVTLGFDADACAPVSTHEVCPVHKQFGLIYITTTCKRNSELTFGDFANKILVNRAVIGPPGST